MEIVMKKLLIILLCLPFISLAQQTYIPDDNFEQALINLGYDNVLDNCEGTTSIEEHTTNKALLKVTAVSYTHLTLPTICSV